MCVHVRVWRSRLLSVRNRNRHAHSACTEEGLRKRIKKIMHRGPSRGVDPASNFSTTQTLHIPVHSNTRPHQSRVDPMHRRPSQSFERSNISCRRNLLFYRLRFSPNSDCICTESNLHVFCSKRYTGSVLISIETSAKSKIRIHSAYPGPRNKDCT